jgi:UDPglucose--hexose-1-phosphate uridylyltransferase
VRALLYLLTCVRTEQRAVLPYRRHIPSLAHLTTEEKRAFAQILSATTKRYDNLFSCSFAYSMGIHQRPTPAADDATDDVDDVAHLHLHFMPPLLRSATVRKFLVGCVPFASYWVGSVVADGSWRRFELAGEAQRDLTPEQAAGRLRACSEIHYLDALETEQSTVE